MILDSRSYMDCKVLFQQNILPSNYLLKNKHMHPLDNEKLKILQKTKCLPDSEKHKISQPQVLIG